MVKIVGGYEDAMKRLGVNSWQGGTAGAAPSYHFDMLHDEERNLVAPRNVLSAANPLLLSGGSTFLSIILALDLSHKTPPVRRIEGLGDLGLGAVNGLSL